MDNVTALAWGIRGLFVCLQKLRVPAALKMDQSELRATAHGLSYALLASLWQWRTGAQPWPEIYPQWERRPLCAEEIDPALYGYFDAADRFDLLTNNRAAFEAREQLLSGAQRSVDIATYYIQADETGWRTARQLAACARRGVRVRVVADLAVMQRKIYENPGVAEIGLFLSGNGIEYRLFSDPDRLYDASHRKFLVVDGSTLITGGRNYSDQYSGDEWRDIDLQLTGPTVAGLQSLIEQMFEVSPNDPPPHLPSVFQITTPAGIGYNAAFRFLIQCIRACGKTLDIENAYYINHPVLQQHIAAACARGVRVRVFTNSAEANDLDFISYRIYSGFADLLNAGVEIYLRTGKGRTLHCKYFVADGEWVGFGSSNLDFYSPRFCRESGIHARSPDLAEKLARWFEEGIAKAEQLRDTELIKTWLQDQVIGRLFDRYLTDIQ